MSEETTTNATDSAAPATPARIRENRPIRIGVSAIEIPLAKADKARGWLASEAKKMRVDMYTEYKTNLEGEGGTAEKFEDWVKANRETKENPNGIIPNARTAYHQILAKFLEPGFDAFWTMVDEAQTKEWKKERSSSVRVTAEMTRALTTVNARFPMVALLSYQQFAAQNPGVSEGDVYSKAVGDTALHFITQIPEELRNLVFFANCDLSTLAEFAKSMIVDNTFLPSAEMAQACYTFALAVLEDIERMYADVPAPAGTESDSDEDDDDDTDETVPPATSEAPVEDKEEAFS